MNALHHAPTVGGALAARRHQLELSRAELARRCAMTENDLRRIEQGLFVPSPVEAYRLADELELDPEPLCRWTVRQLLIFHREYLVEHAARAA